MKNTIATLILLSAVSGAFGLSTPNAAYAESRHDQASYRYHHGHDNHYYGYDRRERERWERERLERERWERRERERWERERRERERWERDHRCR